MKTIRRVISPAPLSSMNQEEERPEDTIVLVNKDGPNKLIFETPCFETLRAGNKSSLIVSSPPEHVGKVLSFYHSTRVSASRKFIIYRAGLIKEQQRISSPSTLADDTSVLTFSSTAATYASGGGYTEYDTSNISTGTGPSSTVDATNLPDQEDDQTITTKNYSVNQSHKWEFIDSKWLMSTLKTNKHSYQYVLDVDQYKNDEERRALWLIWHQDDDRQTKRYTENNQVEEVRIFQLNLDGTISPDSSNLCLGTLGDCNQHLDARFIELARMGITQQFKMENLIRSGVKVNTVFHGTCALEEACRRNDTKTIRFLFSKGATANVIGLKYQPLNEAAYYGHLETIKILLKNKANVNYEGLFGDTVLGRAALCGHVDVMNLLIDAGADVNGGNPSICNAIANDHLDAVRLLLQHGASLDVSHPDHGTPIQQACSKEDITFVSMILAERGDLRVDTILHNISKEEKSNIEKKIIKAYAELDSETLCKCITRAVLHSREIHHHPSSSCSANPIYSCMRLAELSREQWSLVRRVDVKEADKLYTLYRRLQLGATAILEHIHQDLTGSDFGRNNYIISSKKDNLDKFLKMSCSEKAISLAQNIQAKIFFAQPLIQATTSRYWYGNHIYEILMKPSVQIHTWIATIGWLFIQLPLLCIAGYLPRKFQQMYISKESKDQLIVFSPIIRFLTQCFIDLLIAVAFSIIDDSMPIWANGLLLFALCGAFTQEYRELSMKGTNYFSDKFNFLDAPALVFATLGLSLDLVDTLVGGVESISFQFIKTAFFCFASIFLWLRMLRVLTLSRRVGPLVLMVFNMAFDVFLWLFIFLFFILAFTSGLSKFDMRGDRANTQNGCSVLNKFAFSIFLEDALTGGDSLFECRDKDERANLGFSNFVIYAFFLFGNVLLLNMLIAIMNESFSSVWESQVANAAFQNASQCLDMREMNHLPLSFLYLPYSVFSLISSILKGGKCKRRKKHNNENDVMHSIDSNTEEQRWGDNPIEVLPTTKTEACYNAPLPEYVYEKTEAEMTRQYLEYIQLHEDESVLQERWRATIVSRVSNRGKKIDELYKKIDDQDEKIEYLTALVEELLEKKKKH